MQEELLQFKLQQVWTLVDLPNGKRTIGYTTKRKELNYDEVFAPFSRIEAIRLFLAYALFKDFVVYQMDIKSTFLYGKIEEESSVVNHHDLKMPYFPDKFTKGRKGSYGCKQAPKSFGELTFFLGLQVKQKEDGIFISQDKSMDLEHDVSNLSSRLDIMFTVLLVDSPFDLVAYTDSGYAGAILDRKSTIGGCQFLRFKLLTWEKADSSLSIKKKEIITETSKRSRSFNLPEKNGLNSTNATNCRTGNNEVRVTEDASKQGRKIADIDADVEVTLINETHERNDDNLMFDTGVLDKQEVEVEKKSKQLKTQGCYNSYSTTTTRYKRPKLDWVVFKKPSEFTKTTSPSQPSQLPQAKDKGKAKMAEPEKPLKKKDQILIDEKIAQRLQEELQAELEEEERLARQKKEDENFVE
ncbi:putative ribonuclease H-like domain-containing protein [Tanacetum coccineum]